MHVRVGVPKVDEVVSVWHDMFAVVRKVAQTRLERVDRGLRKGRGAPLPL